MASTFLNAFAGFDPLEAVKYQILVMALFSGGSGLSALAACRILVCIRSF
jgi:ABC-type iron transport system FetAB permease component